MPRLVRDEPHLQFVKGFLAVCSPTELHLFLSEVVKWGGHLGEPLYKPPIVKLAMYKKRVELHGISDAGTRLLFKFRSGTQWFE